MSTSDAATFTRTIDGEVLPTPGTFVIDPAHTHVGFAVRHMMIAKVRGRFTDVSGMLEVAEDPTQSKVEIEVNTGSVDTRDEQRDAHLCSPDFFDIERYPTITFRGAGITLTGDRRFRLDGELTIRDVTRALTLDVSFNGLGQDPWGNQRVGFDASGEVDREDFGLTWNQALETGGVLVAKQVRIELEAEFVRQS